MKHLFFDFFSKADLSLNFIILITKRLLSMLRRQFRSYTKKDNRTAISRSKAMSRASDIENTEYSRLTQGEIHSITRTVMRDPKAHLANIGVISSIKGKMYCLKLGAVSSSKDFAHYFYSMQYRRQQQKAPLSSLNPTNHLPSSENFTQNQIFSTILQR